MPCALQVGITRPLLKAHQGCRRALCLQRRNGAKISSASFGWRSPSCSLTLANTQGLNRNAVLGLLKSDLPKGHQPLYYLIFKIHFSTEKCQFFSQVQDKKVSLIHVQQRFMGHLLCTRIWCIGRCKKWNDWKSRPSCFSLESTIWIQSDVTQ